MGSSSQATTKAEKRGESGHPWLEPSRIKSRVR